MSTNITREHRLTALVLTAPDVSPHPQLKRPYCAWSRAQVALGRRGDLFSTASELGFSWHEAVGVMRGWDGAEGRKKLFQDDAEFLPDDVARGEAIGARLHALVCAQSAT